MVITGEEVKAYRLSLNYTQSELAEVACVSEGTVKNWERNGIPAKKISEAEVIQKIKEHK